jgi:DNA-binding transcriptional ArsR family regulator
MLHPMSASPYIAEAAALIGDPARANMLVALMDGRALTATELGLAAGVAPSTASEHLAKLVEGELIKVAASGRHRYFRLGSPRVAAALESLMVVASDGPRRYRPQSRCDEAAARARTCYDHFAGGLGVGIADGLVERGHAVLSEDGGAITPSGLALLERFGADLAPKGTSRRAFCRACLDWSERRWHIGGRVGAAIAERSFELGWAERQRDSRAVTITQEGLRGFESLFGLNLQSVDH